MNDFIKAENIFLDVQACNVNEALHFISKQAEKLEVTQDANQVYQAFQAREEEGTTGTIGGFAIPHAKSQSITSTNVIVVKFQNELTWESLDNNPINTAIALLVPDNEANTTHIKLLSHIAMLVMEEDFRNYISQTSNALDIASFINQQLSL